MAFKDLGDWADLAGLKLPIGGKVYVLPPVSAELGPRLQTLVSAGVDVARGKQFDDSGREVLDDLAERDLYREVLGSAYDEMVDNGVPWLVLKHAALTSIFDVTVDRDTAERYWESLGKRAGRQPADRKTTGRKGTASRTKPASTAGTTTSRKPAAKATPGRRSSSTGR